MALSNACFASTLGLISASIDPALGTFIRTPKLLRARVVVPRVAVKPTACTRRTANYEPSSWDYLSFQQQALGIDDMDQKRNKMKIEGLKEEARHLLYNESELGAKLELIDALQHLGLARHFHEEIKNILGSIPIKDTCRSSVAEDLHASALLFRLLRENGFQISQDIFNAFKDDKGHFKESICNDPKGMLSLYEASHLAFEGEETLEGARIFTTKHLKELKDPQIDGALELPLHWRCPRLDVKRYVEGYEKEGNVDPVLLRLAKLDFNMVQSTHQEELKRLAKWLENLGVAEILTFARDRLVECFYFGSGIVSEPELGYCREETTKAIDIVTKLDDLYDIYGSLDQLVLFTNAINKWDINATEGFPEYLKTCYSIVFDSTNEIADNIESGDGVNVLSCLKRAWADLCNSFLVEAKWHHAGYFPTLEEYLDNAWISSSGHVLLTYVVSLSPQKEEAMQCLESSQSFSKYSSMIFRLCNDLATSAAEIERGDAPSSILCYMHENGVTEETAREEIKNLIRETWKKLNKEVADCGPFSRSLVNAAINLARISHCTYQTGDGIGAPDEEKKTQIKSTFLEPVTTT